jgi:hypothetical protein
MPDGFGEIVQEGAVLKFLDRGGVVKALRVAQISTLRKITERIEDLSYFARRYAP